MKRRPARKTRHGRGTLVWISGFLILSALLRGGGVYGPAIAETLAGGHGAPAPQTGAPDDAELAALLSAMSLREERIAAREQALDARMQALKIAEDSLKSRLAELRDAEEALKSTIVTVEGAAEADLAQLTQVYENMKAAEASLLFQQMSPEFAAGFLGRMRADAAAGILSGLDPAKAYEISVILAGRNALAPKK